MPGRPSISDVGAPPHTAKNVKIYLTRNGQTTEVGYWDSMSFTAGYNRVPHTPVGANAEYGIVGLSYVRGTLERGHINANLLKHMRDAMDNYCEPAPTYTIEAEYCYPDGRMTKSTVVIKGVDIPELTENIPNNDKATESMTFNGQYYEVFDFAKTL